VPFELGRKVCVNPINFLGFFEDFEKPINRNIYILLIL